jgi:transposase InsO family protein
MRKVGRHFGFTHSAVSKWCAKAPPGGRLNILTRSSRPLTSPKALDKDVVENIIRLRKIHNRCAPIIHQELLNIGITVSLSSVKRTLKRKGLIKAKSKWKRYHQFVPRPVVDYPGDLVQLDTVFFSTIDGERFYLYTIIDLASRWAYARISTKLNTYSSISFIQEAINQAKRVGINIKVIQTDHGTEFSTYFSEFIKTKNIIHRHSRVRKPIDNAHIERFNQSIQYECLKDIHPRNPQNYQRATEQYLNYYNHLRLHLGINKLTPSQKLQMVPRS